MHVLPVDSYGDCLHSRDLDWLPASHSTKDIIRNYKVQSQCVSVLRLVFKEFLAQFVLALESTSYHDYATEKLRIALEAGVVPIVMDPPNVEAFLPTPAAAIQARKVLTYSRLLIDFSGVQVLYRDGAGGLLALP